MGPPNVHYVNIRLVFRSSSTLLDHGFRTTADSLCTAVCVIGVFNGAISASWYQEGKLRETHILSHPLPDELEVTETHAHLGRSKLSLYASLSLSVSDSLCFSLCLSPRGLGGVVGLTLPMARADRGSRPVYYLPCSNLGQVVNLSMSVA